MSSQHAFLARVREALHSQAAATTQPHASPSIAQLPHVIPPRVTLDHLALVERLQTELAAVGGKALCVPSVAEATRYITELAQEKEATLAVRWQSDVLDALEIDAAMRQQGVEVQTAAPTEGWDTSHDSGAVMETRRQELRDMLTRADMGLSGVDCALAETGTLALAAKPGQMRGVSLLPPVHVAVMRSTQLVERMEDYLAILQADDEDVQRTLTSCISFITGPSRTADIELSLTIGVHGPVELHLIIIDEPSP